MGSGSSVCVFGEGGVGPVRIKVENHIRIVCDPERLPPERASERARARERESLMNAKMQTKSVVLTNHAVWLFRSKLENEASTISKNFQSVSRVAQNSQRIKC